MRYQTSAIDITHPPYCADPTGQVDATDVIIRALNDITNITRESLRQTLVEMEELPKEGTHYHPLSAENKWVDGEMHLSLVSRLPYIPTLYFPEGTYLVADTLCYQHTDLQNPLGEELNMQIRIRGAGVGKSVVKLCNNTPGFGEGACKPIISYMRAKTSNVAMSNYCEDLTIDSGTGNPGAVGLDFFANNSGAIRNVHVTSGDGSGFAGIQLGHSTYSGILLKHIEIDGFDHGLHVDSGNNSMFAHAENIVTRNQRISGVTVGSISLSIRDLYTENVPAGLTTTDPRGFTVLIDSHLSGNGHAAIDHQAGFLYASNVTATGFSDAQHIEEWVTPRAVVENTEAYEMPRLPIEDTPIWQPHGKSVGVRTFGAKCDGINDDSAAIQQAMDSGAEEIIFEPGRYRLDTPVTIPSHVEHIDFRFCDIESGENLQNSDLDGFIIHGNQEDVPLFIERLFAWEQWSGDHCTFGHASKRTLCLKDIHTQTLKLYRNTISGGKVFLDNVATTTGVRPGTDDPSRTNAVFTGQKVWARQFNPERGWPMVINDGSDLVIMGYKSEGRGIVVKTINDGRTEIIGGVMNIGRKGDLAFHVDNGSLRLSTTCQNRNAGGFYETIVKNMSDGGITEYKGTDFPLRGPCADGIYQCAIPLWK